MTPHHHSVEKKTGYKRVWFWDAIFRSNVDVVAGVSTGEQISEWLKTNRGIDYPAGSSDFHGRTITVDGGLNVFIFLRTSDLACPEFHATLAHEAFHASHMILSLRGQGNHADDGEECHAYVLGWIVRETVEGLKKLRKRK